MAVSVMNPQPKKEREPTPEKDPLDTILKGLNIAATAYGIYDKYSTTKLAEQKLAEDVLKNRNAEAELANKAEKEKAEKAEEKAFQREKFNTETDLKKQALELQRNQQKVMQASNSFKSLPQDQQILVEKFSAEKAKLFPIVNQFDQYISQLEDPEIPENQKIQIGMQSLKLMNSPNNPDAVGAEEVKRIGSFLKPNPDPFGPKGWKVGVDIEEFTKAVKNTRERSSGNLNEVSNQIDTILGRMAPLPSQVPTPQKQSQQSQSQSSVLQNRANAAPGKLDFSKMTDIELQKWIGRK